MPEIEFCQTNKAWIKHCSGCDRDFVGVADQRDSETLFDKHFDTNSRSSDGYQHYCKECCKRKRRIRKGVLGGYDEDEMFRLQGGKCALCRIELFKPYRFPADPQGARVDHDHKTGVVRGLLCHSCNAMLGTYEAIMDRNPQFDPYAITVYLKLGQ